MNRFLLLLAPVTFFFASCATNYTSGNAREQVLRSKGYAAHNLHSINDDARYWSRIKIAGNEMRMLLDTGANSTDIDKDSAESIGLKQNTDFEVISKGALGRKIRSKLSVTSLQYGPQKLNPFVVVINEGQSKSSSVGKYNGQVGLDAMVESATVIDIAARKVWMPRKDILSHSKFPLLGKTPQLGFEPLPLFSHHKYSHLILKGRHNTHSTNWIIDTGAEVSIIDSASAKKLGLRVVKTNSKMIDISGDSSSLGFTIVNQLKFGQTTMSNLPLAVANLSNVKKSFKLPDGSSVDGILGVDFLKASQALIDPRSKLIHMGQSEYRTQAQARP